MTSTLDSRLGSQFLVRSLIYVPEVSYVQIWRYGLQLIA